jgi:hypothetical protein
LIIAPNIWCRPHVDMTGDDKTARRCTIDSLKRDLPHSTRNQNRVKLLTRNRNDHMPSKLTNEMIEAAILGSEEQKRRIDVQIAELRAMLSDAPVGPAAESATPTPTGRPRRKVSAAGRKAMALAQQKRWAAKKAESAPEATAATKPKRKMSAAGKAAMIAAIKKRWAEKRAAAKK